MIIESIKDQILTSFISWRLLHFFFDREIAAKLQLKCSMLPANPDDACHVSLSTTHLVAISNQVSQRNESYIQFLKGFMLRKHSNRGMGKGCVKMAKNDQKYFILLH